MRRGEGTPQSDPGVTGDSLDGHSSGDGDDDDRGGSVDKGISHRSSEGNGGGRESDNGVHDGASDHERSRGSSDTKSNVDRSGGYSDDSFDPANDTASDWDTECTVQPGPFLVVQESVEGAAQCGRASDDPTMTRDHPNDIVDVTSSTLVETGHG